MSLGPRAFDMLASMKAAGRRPGRWRCSPDLGTELGLVADLRAPALAGDTKPSLGYYELRGAWGGHPAGTRWIAPPDTLFGLPVAVDEALPPNSLILDPE